MVNAVLIRALPFASPASLVQVAKKNDSLNITQFAASVLNYLSWKEQNHCFERLGAIGAATYTLPASGGPKSGLGFVVKLAKGCRLNAAHQRVRAAHVMLVPRNAVANRFGTDILIQAPDPRRASHFYVEHLGFEITDDNPKMIGLHGKHINLFIEPGPTLGPVLEVTVDNVAEAKQRLVRNGCEIVKDEPDFPRCYVQDPFGLIYNLTS